MIQDTQDVPESERCHYCDKFPTGLTVSHDYESFHFCDISCLVGVYDAMGPASVLELLETEEDIYDMSDFEPFEYLAIAIILARESDLREHEIHDETYEVYQKAAVRAAALYIKAVKGKA